MATEDERDQLRRLTTTATVDTTDDAGATTTAPRVTDAEADRLLARYRCPAPREQLGAADTADVYGAAAAWWEEQAYAAQARQLDPTEGTAVAAGTVKRATVGDVSVEYAAGSEGGSAGSSPAQLFAIARRLWRRSCTRAGGAYTADLVAPSAGAGSTLRRDPESWDTSQLPARPVVLGTDPVVNG